MKLVRTQRLIGVLCLAALLAGCRTWYWRPLPSTSRSQSKQAVTAFRERDWHGASERFQEAAELAAETDVSEPGLPCEVCRFNATMADFMISGDNIPSSYKLAKTLLDKSGEFTVSPESQEEFAALIKHVGDFIRLCDGASRLASLEARVLRYRIQEVGPTYGDENEPAQD